MAEPWRRGRDAALALRAELELGWSAVNPFELIRHRGVHLALREFGSDAGDGLYLWNHASATASIVLNTSHRWSRVRFSAAHELGHHEMHREQHQSIHIEDHDIFAKDNDAEREADAFAAYLLAPDQALQLTLRDDPGPVTPETIVGLMRRYGLSYGATLWRLVNCNVITRDEREALHEAGTGQIDALVRRAGFTDDGIFPAGEALPDRFRMEALGLYRDHYITLDRLAALLRTTTAGAHGLAEETGTTPRQEAPYDEHEIADLLS